MTDQPGYRRNGYGQHMSAFWFTAEDCRNLADCLPGRDTFATELLEEADRLDSMDEPDPEAPLLRSVALSIRLNSTASSHASRWTVGQ